VNRSEEWQQPGEPSNESPNQSTVEFEQQLTQAFRLVAPPEGFAGRVVARVQSSAPAPEGAIWRTPRSRIWASGALAASVLAGLLFAQQAHVRRQRQEAERAEHQFDVAIRITDEALEQTRRQLQQAGVDIGN